MFFFFWIHVLKIDIERWFWEVNMVFRSLVELHTWLHSFLCFYLLEKLFLKASSTPPRHLVICRALKLFFLLQSRHLLDNWWIDRESSWTLGSFSIAGGSIELLFSCLYFVPQHLLDSCICWRCFSRHLPRQMAQHLSTPLSVENYWGSIYMLFMIQISFPWSLSICPHLFISQTLSSSHLTSSSSILRG